MPAAARHRADAFITDGNLIDDPYVRDDEDVIPERSSAIQSGWDAALRTTERSNSGYTNDFKFTEDPQLVKFLASEPLAVYGQHWIERPGKKSWTCLGDENECPLCATGDKPSRKVAFSVVNLSADPAVAEILTISPKTMQILARFHQDKTTGPLDRLYYSLSRQGTGPKAVFNILPVKPRDLDEDWGIPQTEADAIVSGFEPLDSKVISFTSRAKLEEIKREINNR